MCAGIFFMYTGYAFAQDRIIDFNSDIEVYPDASMRVIATVTHTSTLSVLRFYAYCVTGRRNSIAENPGKTEYAPI